MFVLETAGDGHGSHHTIHSLGFRDASDFFSDKGLGEYDDPLSFRSFSLETLSPAGINRRNTRWIYQLENGVALPPPVTGQSFRPSANVSAQQLVSNTGGEKTTLDKN